MRPAVHFRRPPLAMVLLFALLVVVGFIPGCSSQSVDLQPLMQFLQPETMKNMAEIAGELSTMAARNMVNNERDVQKTVEIPREVNFDEKTRPSQVLGQTLSNLATQSRSAFLDAIGKMEKMPMPMGSPPMLTTNPATPSEPPPPQGTLSLTLGKRKIPLPEQVQVIAATQDSDQRARDVLGVGATPNTMEQKEYRLAEAKAAPTVVADAVPSLADSPQAQIQPEAIAVKQGNAFDSSPFMQIAKTFLGRPDGAGPTGQQKIPQIGIRDLVPNADNNFGLPKGRGCLPFLSEFMQAAYGNCQQVADEKTFDAWGDELRNAIMIGQIDLLKASQETCRRGAERQQCDALRQAIADCDVIASLNIGTQLQRAMKRCEEVSGLVDQSPIAMMGQLKSLIGGELAQGFLNNFLKPR